MKMWINSAVPGQMERNGLSELEARERERTGIKSLKIKYNRVFGYSLEVTNTFKDLVPENYIRKQTLTNAERYITQELKDLEDLILGAEDKLYALEYELFSDIRDQVGAGGCPYPAYCKGSSCSGCFCFPCTGCTEE